jgi:hypothetical protein
LRIARDGLLGQADSFQQFLRTDERTDQLL